MTTDTPDDAVPVAELRELIAEWRESERTTAFRNGGDRYAECADDLETLLADVEGERDE